MDHLRLRQDDSTTSTIALAASFSLNRGRNLALAEQYTLISENVIGDTRGLK